VNIVDAVEGEAGGRPTDIVPDANTRGFSLVQGEPTDTIVVTWHYETRTTSGATDAAYAADGTAAPQLLTSNRTSATRFATAAAPSTGVTTVAAAVRGTRTRAAPDGTAGRGTAGEGTTVKHDRITTYIIPENDDHDYRDIRVTIGHEVTDGAGTSRDNTTTVSVRVDLDGVPHGASGLMVERDIGGGTGTDPVTDEIEASWSGRGSPQLEHRVALYVQVETGSATENRWEWVVLTATPTLAAVERDTNPDTDSGEGWGKWNMEAFDLNATAGAEADVWQDDDAPALTYTVSQANLRKASHIRVDTRADNTGGWVKGTAAAISAG
jgi:hypothetical protein